jgi:hypothetical protein
MRTGGPLPGGKARHGRYVNHSPPSSADVVNEYQLYILSPLLAHRCVVGLLSRLLLAWVVYSTYYTIRVIFMHKKCVVS